MNSINDLSEIMFGYCDMLSALFGSYKSGVSLLIIKITDLFEGNISRFLETASKTKKTCIKFIISNH